jgi:hypothetical protein
MTTITSFKDLYSFTGFRASIRLKPHPEHPGAHVTTLKRRQKKLFVHVDKSSAVGTIAELKRFATLMPVERQSIWSSRFGGLNAESARP